MLKRMFLVRQKAVRSLDIRRDEWPEEENNWPEAEEEGTSTGLCEEYKQELRDIMQPRVKKQEKHRAIEVP